MKRKPGLKCPKLEATIIKAEAHQDGSAVHAGQVSRPKLKPCLKKRKEKKGLTGEVFLGLPSLRIGVRLSTEAM